MAHKFDPAHKDVLDDNERKKIFPVDKVMEIIGCKKGDIIGDVGCGTGYLSIPAAHIVGEQGKVYGFDTSKQMLKIFKKRVEGEGFSNIVPVLSSEYKMPLKSPVCNYALMANVFHEVDDRIKFAKAAEELLADDGELIVFEMNPGAGGVGPPDQHRLARNAVEDDLQAAGYSKVESGDVNEYFYFVKGTK